MGDSLWKFILLSILLVRGVAPDCGSLLVDPCNQGQSVSVEVCVLVGTSLTIACNVQDTAAAWLSPNFATASISASVPLLTRLNDMVELKYINQTHTCVLSTATIDNVQSSLDGLDLFCGTHVPGRSAANISIGVRGDSIASVKQIAVNLTTDEMSTDLEFFDDQDCQFDKYLISEGSCSQQNDSTIIAILESPTMQKRIKVNSFSELCVSACTEEEVCTCREIDLDGFTVISSQEMLKETSYSVVLSFSHDILIESVGVSPHGNGANCDANNQTSKQVMLSCSDLSNSTTYSVTVEGNASLINNEDTEFAVSLEFTIAAHMDNETVDDETVDDETVNDNALPGGVIAAIVVSSFFLVLIIVCLVPMGVVFVLYRIGILDLWRGNAELHIENPDSPGSSNRGLELGKKRMMLNKVKKMKKNLQKELSANDKMEHKLEKDIEDLENQEEGS